MGWMMSDIQKIVLMILAALVAISLIVFANDRLRHRVEYAQRPAAADDASGGSM